MFQLCHLLDFKRIPHRHRAWYRRGLRLLALLLVCTATACQPLLVQQPEPKLPERDFFLRTLHQFGATVHSAKTQIKYLAKTQSRFFTLEDHREGFYHFTYDSARALLNAHSQLNTPLGQEELLWFPAKAYIRRNEGPWEETRQHPDQSYSIVEAYRVFGQLESKMTLLGVEGHPDLVEFYYDHDSKSGLEVLAQLGAINLQQLPLYGLRGLAHFFFQKDSGQLQQVDLTIEDEVQAPLVSLTLVFEGINQPIELQAPELDETAQSETDQTQLRLDEGTRWTDLSQRLAAHEAIATYQLASDLRYTYHIQEQHLNGHTVDQLQMVRQDAGYFVRGDRRLQNDRVDARLEYYQNQHGAWTQEPSGDWQRIAEGHDRDPASRLLYQLLRLNQGLMASEGQGKIVYSYSGMNPVFFGLLSELFNLDLSELRGQTIQIDLALTVPAQDTTLQSFRIRLRSPYNDTLDLQASLDFLNYDRPALVEPATDLPAQP